MLNLVGTSCTQILNRPCLRSVLRTEINHIISWRLLKHVTCHLIITNILTFGMSANQNDSNLLFSPLKRMQKKTKFNPTFLCQCRPLVMGCSFGEFSYVEDGKVHPFSKRNMQYEWETIFFLFSLCGVPVQDST